jgi:hypothetical protein
VAWTEHGTKKTPRSQEAGEAIADNANPVHAYSPPVGQTDCLNNIITTELVSGVNDMHVEYADGETSKSMCSQDGKECVSFGTNMTPDEEFLDGG